MTKVQRASKWLQDMFHSLNKGFFDCRLPRNTIVEFADLKKDDGRATTEGGVSIILIHKDLIKHPDLAAIVLFHEMNHVDLRVQGYIGYDHLDGHSTLFHAGIHRLYNAGAYETLL